MSACPTFSQESSLTLTVLYTTLIHSLNLYFISSPSQLLPKSFTKADYVWVPAKSLQLCLTLCDPTDCSLPGSSLHRILQAGILEWVAILLQGSNLHLLQLLHCRQILYHWATGEAQTMHDSISNYYLLIHMHFFLLSYEYCVESVLLVGCPGIMQDHNFQVDSLLLWSNLLLVSFWSNLGHFAPGIIRM